MADKRSAQIKRILAADMAFTNVLVGILMIFFESLWIVIFFDNGIARIGQSLGWDIQVIMAAIIVVLTVPYLLSSLFLASSMADEARMIAAVCSGLIGLAAAIFAVAVWLEVGSDFKASFLISRLPWVAFGCFVLFRARALKKRIGRDI